MNIEKIEHMLPNGFHDAYLSGLRIDLEGRKTYLMLYALMENDDRPADERYKRCELTLHDCAATIVEQAVSYREIKKSRGVQIDRTELDEGDLRAVSEAGYQIPPDNFWLSLFVYSWNSRIMVNARDATIEFL